MENEIIMAKASLMNFIAMLCVFAVMFVFVYIGFMLIMSIWDVIVGLCLRYTVTSYSFAGFAIKYDGRRVSFGVVPARLTATATLTKKEVKVRDIIVLQTLETALTIICAIAGQVFIFMRFGTHRYAIMALVNIGLMIILALFVYAGNMQGVFGKGEKHKLWEHEIVVRNRFLAGAKPRDCEPIEIDSEDVSVLADRCRLYNYYYYLDMKQYDNLLKYIVRFKEKIGDINNVSMNDMSYAYEIVYYYSVIMPDLHEAEHYFALIETVLTKDMDCNGRRVYAGYLYGTDKPVEAVMKVIHQGLTEDNEIGSRSMGGFDRDLLTELKEEILNIEKSIDRQGMKRNIEWQRNE